MSKRCKLQKEYYKEFGNYKGSGKYTDHYVNWLESKVLAINNTHCCESDSEQLKCNHTWIVNHHQGSRYCSKGCDNFEKHTF